MDQSSLASVLPRKRRRPWGRRLAFTLLFLVLIVGAGVLVSFWSASSELSDTLAELDRVDPGWRLADIEANRKQVPDADNSAQQILAVGGASVSTPAMDKMFESLPPQVQLNEQQADYLEKRFELIQKSVALARKLKDMPDGRFPITYSADFFSTTASTLPNIQRAREVADLLQWDAARRAHAFDADGAMESCLALHHVAAAMGDEPMLISLLVRYACNTIAIMAMERTLAQSQFTGASEPALKRVQDALAKTLRQPALLAGLRGERAGLHQYYQALAQGQAKVLPSYPKAGAVETALQQLPGFNARQQAAQLRLYTNVIEALKLPREPREERLQALEKGSQNEPMDERALLSTVLKVRQADLRTQAYLASTLAALAAERFRLAQGRWPESLQALVNTGLLDRVPDDPYDGKPLRLKRTADGLIIYSVGPDRIDNDGTIDRDRPLQPGTDLGFRLWDVARRRQPPNPPVTNRE